MNWEVRFDSLQATTRPDIIRREPQWHHATWHYINEPYFPTEADREALQGHITDNLSRDVPKAGEDIERMNAIQAFKYNLDRFRSVDTSDRDKAVALCWILHIGGDLHQPLHTTAMFTTALPQGDRGGNTIKLTGSSAKNLHAA